MPRKKKDPPSDDLLNAIREKMKGLGPCISNTELAEALDVTKEQMRAAVTVLVQQDEIVKTGKKRWVRYTLASMAGQIPEPDPSSTPKKPKKEAAPVKDDEAESSPDADDLEDEIEPFDNLQDLLEHSIPQLDAEAQYDHNNFGKAVIEQAPKPPKNISEYDVMRELPSLVRNGVMKAFKVYQDGWRFYYRRTGTNAEILSILKSRKQDTKTL